MRVSYCLGRDWLFFLVLGVDLAKITSVSSVADCIFLCMHIIAASEGISLLVV